MNKKTRIGIIACSYMAFSVVALMFCLGASVATAATGAGGPMVAAAVAVLILWPVYLFSLFVSQNPVGYLAVQLLYSVAIGMVIDHLWTRRRR